MSEKSLAAIIKAANDGPGDVIGDLDIDSDSLEQQQRKWVSVHTDRFAEDTKQRRWLAKWAASAVSVWLLLVLVILMFNDKWQFCLTDPVLIVLLGTTTLNVLGLSFIVLRGLFPNPKA